MEKPDPTSIPWFSEFMGLSNSGLVPTVTPTEYMPNQKQVAEFWSPKYESGFTFDSHGSAEYERYVQELYRRVLQVQWPVSGVLPVHFARGLLAEAMHMEVNWCEFAYKQMHPHQSPHHQPRLLPEFAGLCSPLEPLVKIIPHATMLAGGALPNLSALFFRTPLNPVTSTIEVMNATHPPSSSSNPDNLALKLENLFLSSLSRTGRTSQGFPIVGAGAYAGLSTLRNKFAAIVNAEIAKLRQDRHDARSDITKCGDRLHKEKDRLKYLNRKLGEKRDSHDRAAEGYKKAQGVLVAARIDVADSESHEDVALKKELVKLCEALVQSWFENTKTSRHRLNAWEFKSRRQVTVIAKVHSDLEAYADVVMNIDMETENLQAVGDLLKQL